MMMLMMKRLATGLAASGLLALAACGSGDSNNVVANATVANDNGTDTYDVAPDDLTAANLADNEAAAGANAIANNASGNGQ
jgi:ABC-type Fe3+-citrate transport system substrate-binding protein